MAALGGQAEKTYAGQGAARAQESTQLTADIAEAQQAVAAAAQMLEQDRPRAEAQRQKRIQQIEVQLAECDALLSGNGKKAQVEAPFDGRVGFREPSPSSPPSDNGPLLVLYKPGRITATLHLDSLEGLGDAESGFGADVLFTSQTGGRDRELPGTVVAARVEHEESEIVIACDPPDRVIRAIAMGSVVPVRVRLKRAVTQADSFRAGLVLGAVALALAGLRALRRRFQIQRIDKPGGNAAPPANPGGGLPPFPSGSGGFTPYGTPDPSGAAASGWSGHHSSIGFAPGDYARMLRDPASQGRALLSPRPDFADARTRPVPLLLAPGDELAIDERDPLYLHRLGARLRFDLEHGAVSFPLLLRAHQVVGRGGYHSAALVTSGFGTGVDGHQIARAAFDLHVRAFQAPPPAGGLRAATRSCATFLQVMRTVGSEELRGSLDFVRSELVAATLAVAERSGARREEAGSLIRLLVES